MKVAEFREKMPTVSGAGAVLISLVFVALILTSEETRKLAFNWEFAVALVAISIPLSILITQIHHAAYAKFGHQLKKDEVFGWNPKYSGKRMDMHKIDVMIDYLFWEIDKGDKEWVIVQKRATAYHLFSMLERVSISFLVVYTFFLVWNHFCGHFSLYWSGVGLVYGMVVSCYIFFRLACRSIWKLLVLLVRRMVREIEAELDSWIKDEDRYDLLEAKYGERKTTWKYIFVAIFSLLACMILNDFSLHLFELLGIEQYHPFHSFFWSNQMSVRATYTVFWTAYWGLAFVLILLLGVLLWRGFGRRQTQ